MLVLLEILIIFISYLILFKGGYNMIFKANRVNGNEARHLTIFLFNCIVFIRICITFFRFVKRQIPWQEAAGLPFAFAIYYIGFALLGYKCKLPPDYIDALGIVLFLAGSFLNTFSELLRDQWKRKPENKGHLYTGGLFRYAMHINYFGDVLWVTAYAILTRNWYAAIIPTFLFCAFVFFNIPQLDQYLSSKYGQEFAEYSGKTRKFVPFIY